MALLSDADRADVTAKIQRVLGWRTIICTVSKAQLRDAVNATDVWQDANRASYDSSLPLPARSALGLVQKTIIFFMVAMKRAGLL